MRNSVIGSLVGAFVLGSVCLVPGPAQAAKPGGGGADPCAASGLDFPAFAYRTVSGKTHTIYVADAEGKCSRAVTTSTINPMAPKFSYPVAGTLNKGRIVFLQGAGVIYAVDFTVGTGNRVTSDPKRWLTTTSGCCSLDLSGDGQTVYFSETDTSLARFSVAAPASPVRIYTLPPEDSSWFFQMGSVNGDGTRFFATKTGLSENAGGSQLVHIDLTDGTELLLREWVPQTGYGANPFWPSADKSKALADIGQARVAFNDYKLNTNNCTPLTVTDQSGIQLFPASFMTERVGRDPTWVGNDVVMQRRTPMDGAGKCSTTTSISMLDLESSVEKVLVTGYNPDGR